MEFKDSDGDDFGVRSAKETPALAVGDVDCATLYVRDGYVYLSPRHCREMAAELHRIADEHDKAQRFTHDWAWALKQMKAGKSVRRKPWKCSSMHLDHWTCFQWENGSAAVLTLLNLEATDWGLADD